MARPPANVSLGVWLNGRRVGTLRRAPNGAIDFIYERSWLDDERAFAVSLSLPLREERYAGEPVVAVFDNLLPDRDEIRQRIAERAQADGTDSYSLLAAIGRDCVGALQFLPGDEEPGALRKIEGRELKPSEIAKLLRGLAANPLGLDEEAEFRISIAGAQEKTALLRYEGKWLQPHGSTPTTHILKPQIGMLGSGLDLSQSVENEWLCMTLLKVWGLPVAEVEIGRFGKERALVVTRFDRRWLKQGGLLRLPQEDCCQALGVPPTRKYESDGGPTILNIAALLKGSDRPAFDHETLLKAQIAFWMLGATDGHAKNFSVQLHPRGGFNLAPLYDVISAQPAVSAGQLRRKDFRLAMSVGTNAHSKVAEITPRYFAETARAAGMDAKLFERVAKQLLSDVPGGLQIVVDKLPRSFPEAVSGPIAEGVLSRLDMLSRSLRG